MRYMISVLTLVGVLICTTCVWAGDTADLVKQASVLG